MLFQLVMSPDSTDAGWAESCRCETIGCSAHRRPGTMTTPLDIVADDEQDFLWSTEELLISGRVRDTLCRESITGFRTEPVSVTFRSTRQIRTMRKVIVTGWGGVHPETKLQSYCPTCHYQVYCTDPEALSRYEGAGDADLFVVWPFPMFILVDARVAELIEREGWTGVLALPLGHSVTASTQRPGGPTDWLAEAPTREVQAWFQGATA